MSLDGISHLRCVQCGEMKPKDMFARNQSRKTKRQARCKACEMYSEQIAHKERIRIRAEEDKNLETEPVQSAEQKAITSSEQKKSNSRSNLFPDISELYCLQCGKVKSVYMFRKIHGPKNKHSPICILCMNENKPSNPHSERARRRAEARQAGIHPNTHNREYIEKNKAKAQQKQLLSDAGLKQCSRCKEIKAFDEFRHSARAKDGRYHVCHLCLSIGKQKGVHKTKQTRQFEPLNASLQTRIEVKKDQNVAENRRKSKIYDAKTLEKRRATRRAHHAANRERINASRRSYNAVYPEKNRAHCHKYYITHPDRIREARHRRRARLNGGGGSYTRHEMQALREAQAGHCAYCQRVKPLTIDHIHPISKRGRNDIANICLACRKCNSSKGAKLLHEWVNRWYERPD